MRNRRGDRMVGAISCFCATLFVASGSIKEESTLNLFRSLGGGEGVRRNAMCLLSNKRSQTSLWRL